MNDGNRSKILALGAFVVVLIVAVVVGLVAGESDDSGDSASAGPDCSTDSSISTDTSKKPDVSPPEGDAPGELECIDVVEGDGATAESGDQVTVQYVGIDFDTGKQFDASWDNGQPFPFQLGAGSVIDGWDEGVVGMKVGGRRVLVSHPARSRLRIAGPAAHDQAGRDARLRRRPARRPGRAREHGHGDALPDRLTASQGIRRGSRAPSGRGSPALHIPFEGAPIGCARPESRRLPEDPAHGP